MKMGGGFLLDAKAFYLSGKGLEFEILDYIYIVKQSPCEPYAFPFLSFIGTTVA